MKKQNVNGKQKCDIIIKFEYKFLGNSEYTFSCKKNFFKEKAFPFRILNR